METIVSIMRITAIVFTGTQVFGFFEINFRRQPNRTHISKDLLKDVDSLIYVDTDVLFLTSLDDLWANFGNFNSSQLAALTPEHEEEFQGWYNRFARHPYYGKLGLNSGVMLMNLTRMREFEFSSKIIPLYEIYKYNITWGDQCLLNIMFHFFPGF
jgi:UDP-xylose:glucoside alpha-1,3-xylosyltransferase